MAQNCWPLNESKTGASVAGPAIVKHMNVVEFLNVRIISILPYNTTDGQIRTYMKVMLVETLSPNLHRG
jgi:hypothetical protein